MKKVVIFLLSLLLLYEVFISYENDASYLPAFVDPIEGTIIIGEEEVPLANVETVSKTTTKRKKTTKNVKMKSAAKRTYSKKLPTKVKTDKSKESKANVITQVTTKTMTATTEKYTKQSKIKKVKSNITITTVTTTITIVSDSQTELVQKNNINIHLIAPQMDSRVLNAFESLGFSINVDSTVSYTGYFNAQSRSITMKDETDLSIYHELGHFLAFIANNTDRSKEFQAIFAVEKDSYTKYNKTYVTQNASEYFAESVKDYVLDSGSLKMLRPKTYNAIVSALNLISYEQIAKYKSIYGAIWA